MKYVLLFFMIFSTIYADDDDDKHYYSKDLSYFNLSISQKNELKEILKEYREDTKKYRKYRKKIEKMKEKEFLKANFNKENIKKINQKLSNYASKIEGDFLENLHKILTYKQRKKFAKHVDEWEIE